MFEWECPFCHTKFELPDEMKGKQMRCSECHAVVEIEKEKRFNIPLKKILIAGVLILVIALIWTYIFVYLKQKEAVEKILNNVKVYTTSLENEFKNKNFDNVIKTIKTLKNEKESYYKKGYIVGKKKFNELYRKATNIISDEKLEIAEHLIELYKKINSDGYWAGEKLEFLQKASSLIKEYSKTGTEFSKFIASWSKNMESKYKKITLQINKGLSQWEKLMIRSQIKDALQLIENLSKTSGNDIKCKVYKAITLLKQHRTSQANKIFEDIIKRAKTINIKQFIIVEKLYFQDKSFIEKYAKLISLVEKNGDPNLIPYIKGLYARYNKDYKKATIFLQKFINLPDQKYKLYMLDSMNLLLSLFLREKKITEANCLIDKIITKYPHLKKNKEFIHMKLEIALLNKNLSFLQNSKDPMVQLAFLWKEEKKQQCIKLLKEIITKSTSKYEKEKYISTLQQILLYTDKTNYKGILNFIHAYPRYSYTSIINEKRFNIPRISILTHYLEYFENISKNFPLEKETRTEFLKFLSNYGEFLLNTVGYSAKHFMYFIPKELQGKQFYLHKLRGDFYRVYTGEKLNQLINTKKIVLKEKNTSKIQPKKRYVVLTVYVSSGKYKGKYANIIPYQKINSYFSLSNRMPEYIKENLLRLIFEFVKELKLFDILKKGKDSYTVNIKSYKVLAKDIEKLSTQGKLGIQSSNKVLRNFKNIFPIYLVGANLIYTYFGYVDPYVQAKFKKLLEYISLSTSIIAFHKSKLLSTKTYIINLSKIIAEKEDLSGLCIPFYPIHYEMYPKNVSYIYSYPEKTIRLYAKINTLLFYNRLLDIVERSENAYRYLDQFEYYISNYLPYPENLNIFHLEQSINNYLYPFSNTYKNKIIKKYSSHIQNNVYSANLYILLMESKKLNPPLKEGIKEVYIKKASLSRGMPGLFWRFIITSDIILWYGFEWARFTSSSPLLENLQIIKEIIESRNYLSNYFRNYISYPSIKSFLRHASDIRFIKRQVLTIPYFKNIEKDVSCNTILKAIKVNTKDTLFTKRITEYLNYFPVPQKENLYSNFVEKLDNQLIYLYRSPLKTSYHKIYLLQNHLVNLYPWIKDKIRYLIKLYQLIPTRFTKGYLREWWHIYPKKTRNQIKKIIGNEQLFKYLPIENRKNILSPLNNIVGLHILYYTYPSLYKSLNKYLQAFLINEILKTKKLFSSFSNKKKNKLNIKIYSMEQIYKLCKKIEISALTPSSLESIKKFSTKILLKEKEKIKKSIKNPDTFERYFVDGLGVSLLEPDKWLRISLIYARVGIEYLKNGQFKAAWTFFDISCKILEKIAVLDKRIKSYKKWISSLLISNTKKLKQLSQKKITIAKSKSSNKSNEIKKIKEEIKKLKERKKLLKEILPHSKTLLDIQRYYSIWAQYYFGIFNSLKYISGLKGGIRIEDEKEYRKQLNKALNPFIRYSEIKLHNFLSISQRNICSMLKEFLRNN